MVFCYYPRYKSISISTVSDDLAGCGFCFQIIIFLLSLITLDLKYWQVTRSIQLAGRYDGESIRSCSPD